ncbi:MAG: HAMP domain-containing histidine kinase, partial [Planctomycetota bacterium]|nr:HAMP domain-containing histidine kinase [Planctomycetota bacterium]
MRLYLRTRIFFSFVFLAVLLGAAAAYVGVRGIDEMLSRRAREETGRALDVARLAFDMELAAARESLARAVNPVEVLAKIRSGTTTELHEMTVGIMKAAGMDYLALVDGNGRVLARGREPFSRGDDLSGDPLVPACRESRSPLASVEILMPERLDREGDGLRKAAAVARRDERAGGSGTAAGKVESRGLAFHIAIPVRDERGAAAGILVGGLLLNRNENLMKRMCGAIFGEGKKDGSETGPEEVFGYAAIAMDGMRIATAFSLAGEPGAAGEPGPGAECQEAIASKGRWFGDDPAGMGKVACEAIRSREGRIAGILLAGILEKKYDRLRREMHLFLAGGILAATILMAAAGAFFGWLISRPLRRLVAEALEISEGKFDRRAGEEVPLAEASALARSVNIMARAVQERDRRIESADDDIQRANDLLQKANRNYVETLRLMAIEMKALVGTAAMSARSIAGGSFGPVPEKQKRVFDTMYRNLEHAAAMARNLFDLSRIEKGEVRLQRNQVKVREEAIEPVLRELAWLIGDRRMKVVQKVPQEFAVNADPNLLRTVYQNLLSNAIRYGKEEGLIELRGKREESRVILSVFNEGPGVPRHQRDRLFQKFSRVQE